MVEWLEISPGLTLVATATRVFLHAPPALAADPFRAPMTGEGSPDTTHWLLEGTLAAASRAFAAQADAVSSDLRPQPPSSPAHWAYRLAGYFHTTDATRRLLPLVAKRFVESGRQELAGWAEQKISDEAGHDELALRDLSELGYRARDLVGAFVPSRARAWVALFEQLAHADDAVGCVGYAHALERLALLRGPAEVNAIEQALPAGVNATRCLRVHSAVGSDAHHVRTNVTTTSALSADERRAIAQASYLTARIYFDPALGDDFHSARLAAKVLAFRQQPRQKSQVSPDYLHPTR